MCGRVSFVFGLCFISARSNFLKLLFIWVIFHIHARFISAVDFLKVYLTFTFAFSIPCEQAMNGSTVLVGKQRDTAPSRGLVDFVRLDRLYCCVSESLHLGPFFFSFFLWSLYSKLMLFTSYLLRIVVAEIREMWNFLYPFWNCLVFLSLLYQDYNFLWVETPNALSFFFFFYFKANVGLLLRKWSKYHEDDKISTVIV